MLAQGRHTTVKVLSEIHQAHDATGNGAKKRRASRAEGGQLSE
jgi:hypothetical protein